MNEQIKLVKAGEGQAVECQFYLAKGQTFSNEKALIFLVTQDDEVKSKSRDPERVVDDLTQSGRSVFRVHSNVSTSITSLLRVYEQCCQDFGKNFDQLVIIAFGKTSDEVIAHYNDFYQVRPPTAFIFISATSHVIDLNNITCPYYLIYEANDTAFRFRPIEALEEAVHHHQMRYGDSTTLVILPQASTQTQGILSDNDLSNQIVYWLKTVPVAPVHHRPRVVETFA